MEKVVLQLVEFAKKTADRDTLEDRCLKALSKLRSIPVSNAFLLNTNVGNTILSLKLNPRYKSIIRDYASRVSDNWKCQLYDRNNSKRPSSTTHHQRKPNPIIPLISNRPPKLDDHHEPRTTTNCKKVLKPAAKNKTIERIRCNKPVISKAKTKTGSSTVVTHHKAAAAVNVSKANINKSSDDTLMRSNIRQQVFDGLIMVSKETHHVDSDPIGVAMSVKSALFERWGTSNCKYRSFLYNLKDPKNPDFRRNILTKEIKPERIAELKAEEMASNERKCLINNIREIALEKCIVGRQELCF